ncbi:hypothetical protein ABK040_013268 [Willaertia magna]
MKNHLTLGRSLSRNFKVSVKFSPIYAHHYSSSSFIMKSDTNKSTILSCHFHINKTVQQQQSGNDNNNGNGHLALIKEEQDKIESYFTNLSEQISLLSNNSNNENIFSTNEKKDNFLDTLFNNLKSIEKCIDKITWLEGTLSFSIPDSHYKKGKLNKDILFNDDFNDNLSNNSTLKTIIISLLYQLSKYFRTFKDDNNDETKYSIASIGLEIYNYVKRVSLEFERVEDENEIETLKESCYLTLDQEIMNSLLAYFVDVKDKTNTLIILKDMQQLQLGANQQTYNILVRYTLYGKDKNQALNLVNYVKKQGFEIDEETKEMLSEYGLII